MEKFDESEGYWRTVGGRRIFIRDGEDLSSAMKRSGKFKNTKKATKEQEEKTRRLQDGKEIYDTFRQMGDHEMKAFSEKNPDAIEKMQEYIRNKAYENQHSEHDGKEYTMDGKKITESDIKSEYQKEKKAGNIDKDMSYKDYKSSVVDDKNSNVRSVSRESEIKSQQLDIEKSSGLKVKEAFETDLYGNGKADRFILKDGRIVEHTHEVFGKKQDTWSVHNKGMQGESKHFDNFEEVMNYLEGGSDVPKSSEISGIPNRKNEAPGQTISNVMKENQAYRKAYKDYKKKHPNSKISFGKFVDMSEGK